MISMIIGPLVVWLVILIMFSFILIKKSTKKLIFWAMGLLLYGLLPALGLQIDGQAIASSEMIFIGQILAVFASVLCGSLISIGFSEIRIRNQN